MEDYIAEIAGVFTEIVYFASSFPVFRRKDEDPKQEPSDLEKEVDKPKGKKRKTLIDGLDGPTIPVDVYVRNSQEPFYKPEPLH